MIVLPKYMVDSRIAGVVTKESVAPFDDVCIGTGPVNDDSWVVMWGAKKPGIRGVVMETGFFWDASHIDTMGLYQNSSLNSYNGVRFIKAYKAPRSAASIILGMKFPSKYKQTNYNVSWDGVVLALQNPKDRSVLAVGTTEDYYAFVKKACEYYKKNLFLKAHPWNSGDVFERLKSYSDANGCRIEKCNHTVLEECKFVLVYNSSFGMDCFVRSIPVAQYAPGYWHQTGAVTYTAGVIPDNVFDTVNMGHMLADFIIWNYCFDMSMPIEKWRELFKLCSCSNALFPIPENYSYASQKLRELDEPVHKCNVGPIRVKTRKIHKALNITKEIREGWRKWGPTLMG